MKQYILLVCTWSCIIINAQHPIEANQLTSDDLEALTQNVDYAITDGEQTFRKPKGYLAVEYLDVNQCLTVQGRSVTGGSQAGFLTSYGQLSGTSQPITFTATDWLAIPFTTAGPTSNMTVSTTSPATITIQNAGVYQVNITVYFSAEDSPEDSFDTTTYTLGLTINGTTTAVSAQYVNTAGDYTLNYSAIMSLSANDELQFSLEPSNLGPDTIFRNVVTLENGNACVLQIAS